MNNMDKRLKEAYGFMENFEESNKQKEKRKILIHGNNEYEILDKKIDESIPGGILAVTGEIKESGIRLHFVFDKKSKEFRWAGITFISGTYIHLDSSIDRESVLMLTD